MQQTTTKKQTIQPSDTLTDIVIGLSDGLTLPFAITAGLSGISSSNNIVITAGIIVTIAGAILLALAGYLAGSNNHAKELPAKLGLSEEVQQLMAADNEKDQKDWEEQLKKNEVTLPKPNAALIGLSYIIGGLVPIAPYFFETNALKTSSILTLTCLFIFGFFKGRATNINPWISALRITIIAALAAGAAYSVAKIFAA